MHLPAEEAWPDYDMDDLKKQLKEQKEIVKELSEEWKKLEEDLLIGQMVSIIEKDF